MQVRIAPIVPAVVPASPLVHMSAVVCLPGSVAPIVGMPLGRLRRVVPTVSVVASEASTVPIGTTGAMRTVSSIAAWSVRVPAVVHVPTPVLEPRRVRLLAPHKAHKGVVVVWVLVHTVGLLLVRIDGLWMIHTRLLRLVHIGVMVWYLGILVRYIGIKVGRTRVRAVVVVTMVDVVVTPVVRTSGPNRTLDTSTISSSPALVGVFAFFGSVMYPMVGVCPLVGSGMHALMRLSPVVGIDVLVTTYVVVMRGTSVSVCPLVGVEHVSLQVSGLKLVPHLAPRGREGRVVAR